MQHDFTVVQNLAKAQNKMQEQEIRLASAKWTERLVENLGRVTKVGGTINVRQGAFEIFINDKNGKLMSFMIAPMVKDMRDIEHMEVFEVCLAQAERFARA